MIDLDLKDRVAIITGGSRGIGRATVEAFAACGTHVVINYRSDESAAQETVRKAEAEGVEALALQCDVREVAAAERLVAEVVQRFKRLDILVCNAGIWEGARIENINEELWDKVIDINLKGTWTMCRAAVPAMKERGFGRIVIVSSTAGQRGEAQVSNYAASKGGQISFAKSLAVELAHDEITVNCVAPGWVETEMNNSVFANEKFRAQVEETIPLRRIPPPEDIARPILFLASAWARHITGEVLNVNGGSVLCG